MDPLAQAALSSWSIDPWLAAGLAAAALCYARGWRRVRRESPRRFGPWRLASFLAGLAAVFVAVASPLDAFADLLLAVHMVQHLLLTMVAPPLILLGAPLVPLLRGLPGGVLKEGLGPFLAWPALRRAGRFLVHPATAWLAFAAANVGGHLPGFYELALRSRAWHGVQHAMFLGSALLFWWPVILPWPARAVWPRWAAIPYLVLADLVNTALASFLVFAERAIYPHYASVPRLWGRSALEDQAAAGALMWVPGSIAYLAPAAALTLVLASGRARPAPERARVPRVRPRPRAAFDLLAVRGLGPLVASARFRRGVQLVLLALAALLVADGLWGSETSALNLAGVLPWTHWRGLSVLALVAAGNAFCMGCPFMLVRDAGRRVLPVPRLRWPRRLRSKWLACALVAAYLWAYEAFALWDSPRATAWIVVGYFAAALAVDALFRGASFCKHVCPIGQFQFVQSEVSPLEIRVRAPEVCGTCRTHDCIRGNERSRGCELELFQPRKSGNLDCTFCLDCVRACPHDNVGAIAVAPGRDLARAERRSSLGRFAQRPDLAALLLLLSFGAFANAAGMTAPVVRWERELADRLGWHSTIGAFSLLFACAVLAGPPLAVLGAAALGRRLARASASVRELACSFAPALVPLGAAMWAAHFLFHLLAGWGGATAAFARAAGDAGLARAATWSAGSAAIVSRESLLALELVLLDLGLLLALYVAWRAAGRLGGARPLRLFAPFACIAAAMFACGCWIVLQPMQMRGLLP